MPSAGTILPAVSPKPFDQMTIEELQRERAYWDRFICNTEHYGASLAVARDCRDMCDALLARRVAPANGIVAGPVSLSHRVPAIGGEPAGSSEQAQ